jgi:AcrR family transcriptional regulator
MSTPSDTRQKILDAAERLIAQQGIAATSVRQIIGDAGVNLASVHYHFGSKEEMLDALIVRKAGPVNAERIALLTRFQEEAAPDPAPVEKVLEAFLAPTFEVRDSSPLFVRVMGRMYAEGLMPSIVAKHFQPVVSRIFAALEAALPHLPHDELALRVHFMIGAMSHTMWGPPGQLESSVVARKMVQFLAAGFRAEVSQ